MELVVEASRASQMSCQTFALALLFCRCCFFGYLILNSLSCSSVLLNSFWSVQSLNELCFVAVLCLAEVPLFCLRACSVGDTSLSCFFNSEDYQLHQPPPWAIIKGTHTASRKFVLLSHLSILFCNQYSTIITISRQFSALSIFPFLSLREFLRIAYF